METVVVINNDQMGHGDRALGQKILATCLRKLYAACRPTAVILYNAGVKLAQKDAHVAVELRLLHDQGVDILPCGTCADHFEIRDRLFTDTVSNMDEILATINKADKVITL
ncbi:MAG: DsrE family protein [Phycisphaerae bacterium]|jgi:hypothetical protein